MKHLPTAACFSPILLSTLILTGCSGGGGSSSDPAPPAPETFLSSLTPTGNATGIELDTNVAGTFSKNLLASSVGEQSLTVRLNNEPLDTNATLDQTGKTVQAEVASEMGLLCQYTATLSGNISDQQGNTLGNDYSWRFTTRDGQWQNAQTIVNDNNVFQVYLNHVETYENGNALSLWSNEVGLLQGSVYASHYDHENNQWQAPFQINTPGTDLNGGKVATNDQGDVLVVWRAQTQNTYHLLGRYYRASTGQWSANQQLAESNGQVDGRFDAAIGQDGVGYVTWSQTNLNNDYDLYVSRYQPETGWQAAEINLNSNEDDYAPRIAVDENNYLTLLWLNISPETPTQADIHTRLFVNNEDVNGGWQPTTAFDVDVSDNTSHTLIMNEQGQVLVTWRAFGGQTSNSLFARHFDRVINQDESTYGEWSDIALLKNGTGSIGRVYTTLNEVGDAIVTWQQESNIEDAAATHVFANRFNAATNSWLTTPVELGAVSDIRSKDLTNSQLISNDNGSAMITWSQQTNDTHTLYSRSFDVTTKQWQATKTMPTNDYKFGSADAIMDDQNHVLSFWVQRTNEVDNLFVSRYNAFTETWGEPTQLSQNPPLIRDTNMATDSKGRTMLLWEQGEGTQSAIMARRFQ
ncbi:Ig-like domain-containing protein [Litoribacillus peritrichatus]|uniref:SbsA Ig-like domain-containing protein n=1 Tax=Litoribacillus peritrichatus TaxID=718191 RepID=A0ABP7MR59_9GAMM